MYNSKTILNSYELISEYSTKSIDKPLFLGERHFKKCRLCSKNSRQVTFKNKAHIIPEGLGNKKLFSYYECDECNTKYGNTIENDLNNLLAPYKLFFKVKGKKGVNKIKPFKDKDRIEYDSNINMYLAKLSSENIDIDESNKIALINTRTQPFSFYNIYKCLLKMSLLLLPSNEIQYFEPTKDFLNGKLITPDPLILSLTNTFPTGIEYIRVSLLRRKSDRIHHPYIIFILMFKTLVFQLNLHLNAKDHRKNNIPIFFDIDHWYGKNSTKQTILCNDKKTLRSTYEFSFRYESSEEISKELLKRMNN